MQEVALLPRAKSNQCGYQVKLTILNRILLKTELIQICVESVSCFFFPFFFGWSSFMYSDYFSVFTCNHIRVDSSVMLHGLIILIILHVCMFILGF